MPITPRPRLRSVLVVCLLLASWGCTTEVIELDPPPGWSSSGADRWWQGDVDTSYALQDLVSLADMGIAEGERTYVASLRAAQSGEAAQREFARAVKQELVALFRSDPPVVDSLFEADVRSRLPRPDPSGDLGEQVEDASRDSFNRLQRQYRAARPKLELGTDVPVPFPDSLRQAGVGGRVRIQAYVSETGEPLAMRILESAHPVLDAIALRATTQMRWEPAYLLVRNQWQPRASWVWYRINFQAPQATR